MKDKILPMLLSTGLLTVSIFSVVPHIQKNIVQAEAVQGKVEKSVVDQKPTLNALANGIQKKNKEVAIKENSTEEENIDTTDRVIGKWGSAIWDFDVSSGTLTIQSGLLGEYKESPWNNEEIIASDIKKINLIGEVVAPRNSSYLFSSEDRNKCLINLNEITGNLNINQTTNLYGTFIDCNSLTKLEINNWHTSQVEDMSFMFKNCYNLTSLDMGTWDTKFVKDMSFVFEDCNNLKKLNLNSWDTTSVTNMQGAFKNCDNLNELVLGRNTLLETNVELIESSWKGKNIDIFYPSSQEFLDNYKGSQTGIFIRSETKAWGTSPYTFDENTGILTVFSGDLGGNTPWNKGEVNAKEILKIDFVGNVVAPQNSNYLFSDYDENLALTNLQEINGKIDTSNVMNMKYMFNGCENLTYLDVSEWDTSQVTDMSMMFQNCNSLTNLDVKGWNTSQVTIMQGMFNGCNNLTSIDVSMWDVSKVENMFIMFQYCNSLNSLNVSNWEVSKVKNMRSMFFDCRNLAHLDVSGWNISQVSTMKNMFYNCSNLTTLNVSEWNTSQITDMSYMFQNCTNLTNLDVGSWDTSQVTDMCRLFGDCNKLNNIDVGQWNVAKVTSFKDMFISCFNLKSIDISDWIINSTDDVQSMFYNCSDLRSILLGENIDFTGKDLGLPDNRWICITNKIRYGSSSEFINRYNGTEPGTYVWDQTADLGIYFDKQSPMVIGKPDNLCWTIKHTNQSTQGRIAKMITGKISTAETLDLDEKIMVEEQDELGNVLSTSTIQLTKEESINDLNTYSYVLPDLTYGNQYKITWKGTPWNNTTVSTAPTFRYELDYDANLELINGDMVLPDSRSTTANRVIENGGLSFKDVPQELRFNATKLSTDLNEQLIAREDKDWEIGITDFRGTKAKSVTDSDAARQDWDLVATVAPFKDSSNQEIGLETLGITYVD
ncbi:MULTISPECIES: BspA family leucine-rich repeat surface protein, partial [unclassified Enterococcus]|uniref:BspA family leucine-rich repeat surface protein n=1 Tax=unclassified Enterococcus TaxID=2608891 RepID=UPI0013EC3355